MHMKKPVSSSFSSCFIPFYSARSAVGQRTGALPAQNTADHVQRQTGSGRIRTNYLPPAKSAVAWAPPPGDPAGEFIHVRFAQPMAIRQVAIGDPTSGAVSKVT